MVLIIEEVILIGTESTNVRPNILENIKSINIYHFYIYIVLNISYAIDQPACKLFNRSFYGIPYINLFIIPFLYIINTHTYIYEL